jgi:hypothetical protein
MLPGRGLQGLKAQGVPAKLDGIGIYFFQFKAFTVI